MASTLLFDNIRTYINGENLVGAVFIDLTKAFNTISHGTLLGKLNEYGVTGIENEWLTNYLFNQSQVVNINGIFSNPQPLLHGTPILGPLLFLLYLITFLTVSKSLIVLCMLMTLLLTWLEKLLRILITI